MSFSFDLNDGFAGFSAALPADGCTQCGICLSVCPTFNISEDVEQSPMGRIRMMRALESGEITGIALEKLDSCLACYSCEAICPSQVNYGHLLDQALIRLREQRQVPVMTRLMLALTLKPRLLKFMVQVTAVTQCFGIRWLLRSLGVFKLLGLARADNLLGKVHLPWASLENNAHSHRAVALFKGCFTSVLEQDVQQAAIDILNALGTEVEIPGGQTCCGALHRHTGDNDQAIAQAKNNIRVFKPLEIAAIITTSSGCGNGLQNYSQWLGTEDQGFAQPVMDISHYLAQVLAQREVVFNSLSLKVAVHTPCTLTQAEGQVDAVTELLQRIPGLELHHLSGSPACCGAGGSQMLSQPEIADALRDHIIDEVLALGPDILVSSNLGCAMHLQAGLEQAGHSIPVQHPVQLLSQAMDVEFVSVRSR
jgi:glycolate oxidase iron-sulfur subunit